MPIDLSKDQSSCSITTVLTILVITSGYYSFYHIGFVTATTSTNVELSYINSHEVLTYQNYHESKAIQDRRLTSRFWFLRLVQTTHVRY